jgi:DNA topoisomerase-1
MRSIAAFMPPCKSESTTIRLKNANCKFYTHSSKIIEPGYRKIWNFDEEKNSEKIDFSKHNVGDKLKINTITSAEVQHAPPPRFNQASLIKELEEKGVGRPSTYNSMANLPIIRGYAVLDKKTYVITPLGIEVADGLDEFFSELINVEFTKKMEENLDEISNNSEN